MSRRYSVSRLFTVFAFSACAFGAVPQWWHNGFANRKAYALDEFANIHRTNCVGMIDISDLVPSLNDPSGADIRVVAGEYAFPKPTKVLTDDAGRAKYVVFTYTLWTSAKPTNIFVYYNYNKFCGQSIPNGRAPVPFSMYRQSDSFYTNNHPAVYLMKIGVYGGVGGTLDFIKTTFNFDYDMITSVPTNKWSYDIVVHNHEYVSNYGTNIITNYRAFMSRFDEVFAGTGCGGGGVVSGNTYGNQTSSERILHQQTPFYIDSVGTYRAMQIWVTNTNHFITANVTTNTLVLDWVNGLCRYSTTSPYIYGSRASYGFLDLHYYIGFGTNLSITNTNICSSMAYRDFRNANNGWAINGREFVCGHLTNAFMMTTAGKRVLQRAFIWTGGMDHDYDLPAASNVIITPGVTEIGMFVKALYISNQGMMLRKDNDLLGAIHFSTNMQTTITPVMVVRNTSGVEITVNFDASKSAWAGNSVYAFTGKYASTVPTGKYLLVVKTNVATAGGMVGSNEFTYGDVYFGDKENADKYRCIPMVIYPNKPELVQTTITMTFPDARRVTAGVYNKNGILIRTLATGVIYTAGGMIRWDGKMDNLSMAPMGLYLIKLDIEREGVFYSRVRVLE